MGLFKSAAAAPATAPAPASSSIKKYNYAQFLEQGKPNPAVVQAAAGYSSRAATSAALQVELESNKKKRTRPSRVSGCAFWMHLLSLAQIAVAVGVIAVVAACLDREQAPPAGTAPATAQGAALQVTYTVCYATTRATNTCFYSYWASAISIAVSVLISSMQVCCPRRQRAACLSLEALLGGLGAAWWLAAGVTGAPSSRSGRSSEPALQRANRRLFTRHTPHAWGADLIFSNEANGAGLPYSGCRTATWALCFANAALFALSFISSAASCCAARGGNADDDDDDPQH
jgi:hypothetical protein